MWRMNRSVMLRVGWSAVLCMSERSRQGEPGRSTDVRRKKDTPLRDVAGMLRSFAYAAETAQQSIAQRFPEQSAAAAEVARHWRGYCETAFLTAYEAAAKSRSWLKSVQDRDRLLRFHVLSRALYEILYEADNRPDWIRTPARGVLEFLNQEARVPA
jgi:maltose alpha-D-glucosyltransferase / alpha-amylase